MEQHRRAVVATEHASRYLQQLCKHWAHKFETEFTPAQGRIEMPLGTARLAADDTTLRIDLDVGPDADAERFEHVVQQHIERFAFRETLEFEWKAA